MGTRTARARKKKDGTEPRAKKPDVLAVDSFDRPILELLAAAKSGGPVNSREADPVHWMRGLVGLLENYPSRGSTATV